MKKIVALAVLAVTMVLAGCGEKSSSQTFQNVDITGAAFANSFFIF